MKRQFTIPILALVVAGVYLNSFRDNSAEYLRPDPLLEGDTLGAWLLRSDGSPWRSSYPCRMAFIMDPRCPGCRMLAAARDTASADGWTWWIAVGDSVETRQFVRTYALPENRTYFPARDVSPRDLGVYTTPLRLILDSIGTVLHARVTGTALDYGELPAICGEHSLPM